VVSSGDVSPGDGVVESVVDPGVPVISVVDSGAVVVNELDVSDGVISNGVRSVLRVCEYVTAGAVVESTAGGWLQSLEKCTTATTRPNTTATAPIPAAAVTHGGLSGSSSGATGADPSGARRMLLFR
jgi:hypothetical protein